MKKSGRKTKKSTDTETIDTDVLDIISQVQKWQIEASSGYNDGWTREHYQTKIKQLREHLGFVQNPINLIT